ncbi:NUDIX hydrolase [Nocardioides sp. TRM66260-LWL]|uniref:NUDIX hydrolase n=1 Tax=Nocardioides sp. TRM66260-LWL TaxID=2874478 RepID=UPI001CC37EFE|nr:NUDIX hydrolase [Nocardioides sp. TRM66260-LWL]MBZ5734777.1 NUDIX hydrolase [Nocardioides sp. TRM66260-LWL]
MVARGEILAAGAVVLRPREVLLVHRPRYDDWSFPKGKLDRGEHRAAAAVREVEEETGLRVRLGRPLLRQRYDVAGRAKSVDYWIARPVGDDDVAGFEPTEEIDQVAWVERDKALDLLTYARDRDVLQRAVEVRKRTSAVVVLRHATARARRTWRGDDRLRPLLATGRVDAARLVPLLAAFAPDEVLTSPSTRCRETIAPLTAATDLRPRAEPLLAEGAGEAREVRTLVAREVDAAEAARRTLLVCSHRPVLPHVFAGLGLDDPGLAPGELLVVHRRHGRVVDVERHGPREPT